MVFILRKEKLICKSEQKITPSYAGFEGNCQY